jgi:hypothetical protein
MVLVAGGDRSPDQSSQPSQLSRWYQSVGAPLPHEGFGVFLSRVARSRVDSPYDHAPEMGVDETFRAELRRFECVSFIESSLGVARCAWRGQPTEGCFVWEVLGLRYRSGMMLTYASRLHYFVDWLEDNRGRWRLRNVTKELGGTPVRRSFFYLTRRAATIPALSSPSTRRAMADVEARLSSGSQVVVGRDRVRQAVGGLRDGDIVAITGNKPGRLVTHAGFIAIGERGVAHLVHASSYHERVVVTRKDLADYVLRRPERRGVIVARPAAP